MRMLALGILVTGMLGAGSAHAQPGLTPLGEEASPSVPPISPTTPPTLPAAARPRPPRADDVDVSCPSGLPPKEIGSTGLVTRLCENAEGHNDGPLIIVDTDAMPAVVVTAKFYVDNQLEGRVLAWYRSGALKEDTSYTLGRREGPSLFYFEDGSPKQIATYHDDKLTGALTLWSAPGALQEEATYVDDEYHGVRTSYDQRGGLKSRANYLMGKRDGIEELWQDGVLRERTAWVLGQMHGEHARFAANGLQLLQETYQDYVRVGPSWERDEAGRTMWTIDGARDGLPALERKYNGSGGLTSLSVLHGSNRTEIDPNSSDDDIRSMLAGGDGKVRLPMRRWRWWPLTIEASFGAHWGGGIQTIEGGGAIGIVLGHAAAQVGESNRSFNGPRLGLQLAARGGQQCVYGDSVDLASLDADANGCGARWVLGPSIRLGWGFSGRATWQHRLVKPPNFEPYVRVMPYIGGSFGELSTGVRLAVGFNAVGYIRAGLAAIDSKDSGGSNSAMAALALPLTLLNHVEFLFELDRTESLGTTARYGFVVGFGM